jgi:hypothetical protein
VPDMDPTDSNHNRFPRKLSSHGWFLIVPPGCLKISETYLLFKLYESTAIDDITDSFFQKFFNKKYMCI